VSPLRKQAGQAPPTWLWATALFAIAAFAGLVMYLDYHQKRDARASNNAPTQATENAKAATEKSATAGKKLPADGNKFDFYQLLPDLESLVSEKESAKEKPSPTAPAPASDKKPTTSEKPAAVTSNGEEFYLQVGAYKQFDAADRMKANLAMLGLKAGIQRVDIGKVGRVHRVRLGPYGSIRDMHYIQQKLKAANIPSIMVRSKVATR